MSNEDDPAGAGWARSVVLSVSDLGISFNTPDAVLPIVTDVNVRAVSSASVCLAGRSGSGKTSVLRAAAGLIAPTSGDVLWEGVSISTMTNRERGAYRRRHLAFLDQDASLLEELTVVENILLPTVGTRSPDSAERAVELLRSLGLEAVGRMRPGRISGGEQQRAALARTLLLPRRIVLLDEPTGSLDEVSAALALEQMEAARLRGSAIVVASHDPAVIDWSDEVIPL